MIELFIGLLRNKVGSGCRTIPIHPLREKGKLYYSDISNFRLRNFISFPMGFSEYFSASCCTVSVHFCDYPPEIHVVVLPCVGDWHLCRVSYSPIGHFQYARDSRQFKLAFPVGVIRDESGMVVRSWAVIHGCCRPLLMV